MKARNPLASKLFLPLMLAAGFVLWGDTVVAQTPEAAAAGGDRRQISDALSKGDSATAERLLQGLQSKKQATATSGNVSFEEITACGFYPQETRLECVIDIKQESGYGGGPQVGSFEYVLFCVDLPGFGWTNVGLVTLPMHDGNGGPWKYAVYRDFPPSDRLRTNPGGNSIRTETAQPTAKARAILSWQTPPTACNFSPVWGNVHNFNIRFDPIR